MFSFRGVGLSTSTSTAAGDHGNDVGDKGHLASALDSVRNVMLMLRAGASYTTGLDLATIGGVLAKELDVLVVDVRDILLAELAVLATRLALFNLPLSSHVCLYLSTGNANVTRC